MNPALLISLGQLLLQLGPQFYAEYQTIKANGSATPADQATLDAQIETMDTQRTKDWATADSALDEAAKAP